MEAEKLFFYSNGLELAVSPYDITFKFLRQGAPDNGQPGVELQPKKLDEITVALSPGHAKAMLTMLYNSINGYERQVGIIPLQERDQQAFITAFGSILKK